MVSLRITAMLLCCVWSTVTSSTILSLTSNPLFTMDALNGAEPREPEQAATVPSEADLWTAETDPGTDGGIHVRSQTAVTSPATTARRHNVADGVENNINLSQLKAPATGSMQPIVFKPFSIANIETFSTMADGIAQEEEHNGALITVRATNKGPPFDDHLVPSLEKLKENGVVAKLCSCSTPRPEEQKASHGERGDMGGSEFTEKKDVKATEAIGGALGLNGQLGEKGSSSLKEGIGEQGQLGQKGDSDTPCPSCTKGESGERGEPGKKGTMGPPGIMGKKGAEGIPGLKGEKGTAGDHGLNGSKGPKGDKGHVGEIGPRGSKGLSGPPGPAGLRGNPGIPGREGKPGYSGPPGQPGRKGEKGQKGDWPEQEQTAFSVGLKQPRSFPLPGSPVQFEKILLNMNNGYNTKTGKFTAKVEGIYFFTFHLSVSVKPLRVGLFHNNKIVVHALTRHTENQVGEASGSILLQLEEDDEIYLQTLHASQNGLMADVNTDSLFSGVLLFAIID